MQYLLAIYEDPSVYPDEQAMRDIIRAHGAYSEMLAEAGVIRGGEGLAEAEDAKTVRKRSGKTAVHDGPHAEMQEQLGGFYIIETDTMEEALEWAAKLPLAGDGSVEVRPCIDDPTE